VPRDRQLSYGLDLTGLLVKCLTSYKNILDVAQKQLDNMYALMWSLWIKSIHHGI